MITKKTGQRIKSLSKNTYRDAFCARVKAARISMGLSQSQMAKKLNVPKRTYEKYEYRTILPAHIIPRFCMITRYSCWYVMTGEMQCPNCIKEKE